MGKEAQLSDVLQLLKDCGFSKKQVLTAVQLVYEASECPVCHGTKKLESYDKIGVPIVRDCPSCYPRGHGVAKEKEEQICKLVARLPKP